MKITTTLFIAIFATFLFGTKATAQPDLEVTAVFVYEAPNVEAGGDSVDVEQVVAIGLTLKNNGVDLLIGDTIRMGWTEVANGSLVAVLSNDLLSGTDGNFIVIQSQTAPSAEGAWEICIWPTYTSKGYSNTDENVGRGCKTVNVYDIASGISELAVNLNKVYFANGVLNLQIDALNSQSLDLAIYNMGGQEVFQSAINKSSGNETVSVNLGHMNSGMYIVKLATSNGQVITEKFFK